MRAFVLVVLIITTSAFGQENPPSDFARDADSWAGWAFQEENDLFSRTNTDKYYTQGLRFSLTRHPHKNWKRLDKFAERFVQRFDNQLDAAPNVWTIGIGQNIYTPDDVTIATPQLNDRHWGGFLYVDNLLQIIDKDEMSRHFFELQTGIVGPGSGARFAQAKIHEIIDSAPPVGWPNQLKNEPAFNLIYGYDWRYVRRFFDLIDTDLQPHIGASLGTVMTYADAGAVVRIGRNNTGFLNGALRATAASNFSGTRPRWEFWVYAGAQSRGVAHNIFLAGGFFRQIPTEIETKRFVYDLMTGFSVRYRRWRLTYNMIQRSSEYSHPMAVHDGSQKFGSVVLSVEKILPRTFTGGE